MREIVMSFLRRHGYDGLCNPDIECGCILGDFMPCDYPDLDECVPALAGDDGLMHPAKNWERWLKEVS